MRTLHGRARDDGKQRFAARGPGQWTASALIGENAEIPFVAWTP